MVQIKKIQAIATGCLILLLTMFASCTKRGGSKCKRTGIYKGVYYGTFFASNS